MKTGLGRCLAGTFRKTNLLWLDPTVQKKLLAGASQCPTELVVSETVLCISNVTGFQACVKKVQIIAVSLRMRVSIISACAKGCAYADSCQTPLLMLDSPHRHNPLGHRVGLLKFSFYTRNGSLRRNGRSDIDDSTAYTK